jgi:hypothetical protein
LGFEVLDADSTAPSNILPMPLAGPELAAAISITIKTRCLKGLIGASATSLPSTWTMLIVAFLGLGFFAYRGTMNRSAHRSSLNKHITGFRRDTRARRFFLYVLFAD